MKTPPNGLVLERFLAVEAGLAADQIGRAVPEDRAEWQSAGFVQYLTVGGTPNTENKMRMPVFTLKLWANAGDSKLPPWNKAELLAAAIIDVANRKSTGRLVGNALAFEGTLFSPAVVHNFMIEQEPREVPGDPGGLARFDMDVSLWWAPWQP